ncbi:MAG: hypothetical protein LBQ30_00390, partial [Treponema sp.]|nr:hypothetical protein [Treponema sp.]
YRGAAAYRCPPEAFLIRFAAGNIDRIDENKNIKEQIEKRNGFAIDTGIFNAESYQKETYDQVFFGSAGRKVTLNRASPEDIALWYPKFNTDLTFQIPSLGLNTKGSFNIFYDYEQIKIRNARELYSKSPYATYIYGDNPVVIIHNNLSGNNKKIVMIKDSLALVVAPFLSLGVETLELIDARYFQGSVQTYIKQSMPDMVMVLYGQMAIDPDAFSISCFDLR